MQSVLRERTPHFLLFNEDDRSLQSAYVLDDAFLGGVPAALRNLLRMARLNLRAMVEGQQSR